MLIGQPEILQRGGELVYRVGVGSPDSPDTLWFAVDQQFDGLVSGLSDAALVALLMPAMARGEDIHLAGTVSERLYHNVSGRLQRVLQLVVPSLHRVAVDATEIQAGGERASGVATGFSGGIDSFSTLADYHYSEVTAGFKLTHLLFNNVGSHGRGEAGGRLFEERYRRIVLLADRIGLPLVRVDSNLDAWYQSPLSFYQTHTIRNASVALLLQSGLGRYLHSASYVYELVSLAANPGIARTDPVTLPLVSTERLDASSVGAEYTRVEKILRVAEIADSYEVLDVCVSGVRGGNCSRCSKCLWTLAPLEIAGLLDRYSGVFDLDVYRGRRTWYLGELLQSDDPFEREVLAFARDRGFSFPIPSRLRAWLKPLLGRPIRALRRIRR